MKCPDSARLQLLLNEQLPEDEFRQVESHVEECPNCQTTLDWLLSGAEPSEPAPQDGTYRVTATSFQQTGVGPYTLTIREYGRKKE